MESSNAHPSPTTARSARLLPSTSTTAQPAYGRRQATLAAFSRRVLSVTNVKELLDAATRAVSHGLGATHVAAFEFDRTADVLHLRAGSGWRDGLVGRAVSLTGTEFHEGYALDRTEPIVVADHNSEIRFAASPLLVEHGVLSSVCAAVRHVQPAFGLLGAYATRSRAFTQDDAQFLQVVADVVSTALARLEAEVALVTRSQNAAASVEKSQRESQAEPATETPPGSALEPQSEPAPDAQSESAPEPRPRVDLSIDIVALASEEPDLQASLQRAAEAIARASGFPMVAIELWDAERETITGAATVFPGQERNEPVEWPLHQTLAGPTIASAQPRFEEVDSTTPERREALQRIGATTFVCFPLSVRERTVGALSLASRDPMPPADDLSPWLTRVCRSISWLVQNHRDGQAAREAQTLTARVLDGLTQSVALVDPHGIVQHVNAALASLLKHPSAHLDGRHFVDFIAPELRDADVWSSSHLRDNGAWQTTLEAEGGARVQVEIERRPLLHGDNLVGAVLLVNEAAGLQPAEESSEESQSAVEPRTIEESHSAGEARSAEASHLPSAADDTQQATDGAEDIAVQAERQRAARIQVVQALDDERSRLARALEDRLAPILSALQLSIQTKSQDRDDLATDLRTVGIALSTIHRLAHRLRPAALESSTLSSLLQDVLISNVESRRVRVEVLGNEPALDVEFKNRVYRLIQDAVGGAFDHAAASDVLVRLGWSTECLDLDTESNATGRDGDADTALETWAQRLEDRAGLAGAATSWLGEPGSHSRMRVQLMLPEAAELPQDTSS